MTETLIPTSVEEYAELTTTTIGVPSGANIKVKALGVHSMVSLMEILPESGISDRSELSRFLASNLNELLEKVIVPNIIEPKLSVHAITFTDAMECLSAQMEISGMTPEDEEELEGFLDQSDSPNT